MQTKNIFEYDPPLSSTSKSIFPIHRCIDFHFTKSYPFFLSSLHVTPESHDIDENFIFLELAYGQFLC